MADFRSAIAVRQAQGDAALGLIDAGAAAGRLRIYAGATPASADDALAGQVLLSDHQMSDPTFAATGADGIATAGAIGAATAAATGDASFFRLEDSTGVTRFQGDVSVTGGGGDLQLSNVSIQQDVEVSITSFTVTVPEV